MQFETIHPFMDGNGRVGRLLITFLLTECGVLHKPVARRILQLREQHRSAITARLGRAAGNGHKVLESLFDRPILGVNDVRELTGTTYAAASNLVSRLVDLGVLGEMTGYARNRRFRYGPYIAPFDDEAPGRGPG